ncbi:hypothetical protein FUAX_16290 [Fulvitalea axinellae]|uniref:Chromosome segregation protein SMC n=1 Tax=Fulvitalea axinellae TaxID=1182444 RepID=A0AAU9CQG3_9BACT|nr:hypothetical protein FUAX_16290 [Fulvitalea axinellae]
MKEERKGLKPIYYVAIAGVFAVMLGVLAYYNYQLGEQKELLLQDLEFSKTTIDDLNKELTVKIEELEELGGDISDLKEAKDELEKEKNRILKASDYTYKQLIEAKKIISGHRQLLKHKDKEIAELQATNKALHNENQDLKDEANRRDEEIRQIAKETSKLKKTVEHASRLEAENVSLFAISRRGKERDGDTWRSKHIQKIKVKFNIAKNDVAPLQSKDIAISLIDGNGQVIFDIAKGSGAYMVDGKETFYTAKQNILFDNSGQELSFTYDRGAEYIKGRYLIKIYTDGYLMGEKYFTVK